VEIKVKTSKKIRHGVVIRHDVTICWTGCVPDRGPTLSRHRMTVALQFSPVASWVYTVVESVSDPESQQDGKSLEKMLGDLGY